MMVGMNSPAAALLPPPPGEGRGEGAAVPIHMREPDHPRSLTPSPSPGGGGEKNTWQARLDLGFERRADTTLLTRREHFGPLRVQKPLYPEGPAVCHAIVLHPPSGIAGGDQLEIAAHVAADAHALLTTPGAGKWYRSAGAWAGQQLQFAIDGTLEWLPQESIVFAGARARMHCDIALSAEARYLGWEILCLGRRASGETFNSGDLLLHTRLSRAGQPLWLERGQLAGGSELLDSPAGLAGFSVSATLLATTAESAPGLLAACRAVSVQEQDARHALTQLPGLLVARYLGHSSEAARHWFVALWQVLRPALIGHAAQTPRIWNT